MEIIQRFLKLICFPTPPQIQQVRVNNFSYKSNCYKGTKRKGGKF